MSSSSSHSDAESDVTKCAFDVNDAIKELTEHIHEQVTEEPDVDVEGDNGHNNGCGENQDAAPVFAGLFNNVIKLTQYDEESQGRNYNILEEKHEDLLQIIRAFGREIQDQIGMIKSLKYTSRREINKQKKQIKELQDRLNGTTEAPEPWSHGLRQLLRGDGGNYTAIYRAMCQQENMSQKLRFLHPNLTLERGEIAEEKLLKRRQQAENKYKRPPREHLFNPRFIAIILPDVFFSVWPVSRRMLGQPTFPFERLPAEIQIKIFARVFVKGGLVHCLSRLDPDNPPLPEDFPEEDVKGRSQLPTAFHYGPGPCQISLACKPNDVLSTLLVCKRWYFIGVHAFYGANTFAFSSLGEWHQFCNGIGMARVERLVNVEMMWHGSQMRRHVSGVSRRSVGLSWFTKTKRLRTLVVHIQELAPDRMRRRYENSAKGRSFYDEDIFVNEDYDENSGDEDEYPCGPSDVPFDPVAALMEQTEDQPNKCNYRSMRTVQGIDYIYQLRGMDWVRFKEREGGRRGTILDQSFIEDVQRSVTQPKRRSAENKSALRNLSALKGLRDWIPSEKDMHIIEAFYNESPEVDWVYGYSDTEDEDLMEVDSESEGESEDESEDESDDDQPASPRTPEAPITPPATPHQQINGHPQTLDDEIRNAPGNDNNDNDGSDRSSDLFVSSSPNSPINHPEKTGVDNHDSIKNPDVNALRDNSTGNANLLTPPSSTSSPQNPPALNPPGGSTSKNVPLSKLLNTDKNKGKSKDDPIDLTALEDDGGGAPDWDYFSDRERFVKDETPPDSDDEELLRVATPPPKRPSKKRKADGESTPKRRKLDKSSKNKKNKQ
ncbi:hypothetical protein F5B19DRAFT_500592 [Rostrohypoxylon terebratum]|nr:hypothetical protein F5B19DRAFT_500592 [Rostrohypoxylon terebratum]